MPLSPEHLADFIKTYENAFDETLSLEEASEMLSRLMSLYRRIKRVRNVGGLDIEGKDFYEAQAER